MYDYSFFKWVITSDSMELRKYNALLREYRTLYYLNQQETVQKQNELIENMLVILGRVEQFSSIVLPVIEIGDEKDLYNLSNLINFISDIIFTVNPPEVMGEASKILHNMRAEYTKIKTKFYTIAEQKKPSKKQIVQCSLEQEQKQEQIKEESDAKPIRPSRAAINQYYNSIDSTAFNNREIADIVDNIAAHNKLHKQLFDTDAFYCTENARLKDLPCEY